jgi:hypothetical protein
VAGWHVDYFEGEWENVPDFSKLAPAKSLDAKTVNIDPRGRNENYALHFAGYFHADVDGLYTFALASDDGSWVKVGGATVVDNDGAHGPETKTGRIRLTNGWHRIEVGYFQGGGAETLKLTVQTPGSKTFTNTDMLVVRAK